VSFFILTGARTFHTYTLDGKNDLYGIFAKAGYGGLIYGCLTRSNVALNRSRSILQKRCDRY
jgi:hypothetical protein